MLQWRWVGKYLCDPALIILCINIDVSYVFISSYAFYVTKDLHSVFTQSYIVLHLNNSLSIFSNTWLSVYFFETGFHYLPKLVLNSWPSCLSHPNVGKTDLCHHAWLPSVFLFFSPNSDNHSECEMISLYYRSCISVMVGDIGHLFICLFPIFRSSLERNDY
jgi:hypothetical protein